MAATDWPLAYLIITAISVGVVVAVWHWFREPTTRYELVFVGLIVGMYTTASVLHYYEATREEPTVGVTAMDELRVRR